MSAVETRLERYERDRSDLMNCDSFAGTVDNLYQYMRVRYRHLDFVAIYPHFKYDGFQKYCSYRWQEKYVFSGYREKNSYTCRREYCSPHCDECAPRINQAMNFVNMMNSNLALCHLPLRNEMNSPTTRRTTTYRPRTTRRTTTTTRAGWNFLPFLVKF